MFIAEGVKIVQELLKADFDIKIIYALKDWINQNQNIQNVTEVSEDELRKISNFETPNKVFAIAEKRTPVKEPGLKNKITLVLDGIQDPGNLGTIVRTADWFGVENIIASTDTADIYNPKVIQATMGSFTRVQIFYIDLKKFLSAHNIAVYGAMLDGENVSTSQKISECLLLIGNEGKGIRKDIQPFIQKKILIPQIGKAESLNAAVATGILLFCLKSGV